MAEKLLYVGLDEDDRQKNLELVDTLVGSDAEGSFGFKVNLDHTLMWGKDYVEEVVASEKPVFVDLKMNNGSRTMSNIVSWLGDMGVAHTNVWAHAESNLAKTVKELADVTDRPAILGVTFYTRWNEDYARTHHNMSLSELISHWSHVAVDNGADGIILPGTQLAAVSDLDTVKLNPAVRMPGQETKSKQEQVSNPYDAIMAGSDILVVGSPIYGSPEPVQALKTFLAEIKRAETDLAA
jgi:orotidine-5'-phosphate decarboxylase